MKRSRLNRPLVQSYWKLRTEWIRFEQKIQYSIKRFPQHPMYVVLERSRDSWSNSHTYMYINISIHLETSSSQTLISHYTRPNKGISRCHARISFRHFNFEVIPFHTRIKNPTVNHPKLKTYRSPVSNVFFSCDNIDCLTQKGLTPVDRKVFRRSRWHLKTSRDNR